jgi:hypothetical protein
MSTTRTNRATGSTTRKVVGSLGVLGAAAAVAGMGTFGTFTDSSTPATTTIASGTVSIDATHQGTLPLDVAGLVPGDSVTRAINLVNDGNSDLGSITLASTDKTPSILTTDDINGLQLTLKSCPVAYSAANTCAGTETVLNTGPAVSNRVLDNPAALTAKATDHLAVTITLPNGAGNSFQNQSAALSLTFTGTQRTGTAR